MSYMFVPTDNRRENTASVIVVQLYIVRWHKWKELEGVGGCVGVIKQVLLERHRAVVTVAAEP